MGAFWDNSLDETIISSNRLWPPNSDNVKLEDWLRSYAADKPTSSNQGVKKVPFQRWFKFKEAYSPKFVADTLCNLNYPVSRVLDPFGGSGTTGLTCRMMGINSITCEVNPFLADLIDAKLTKTKSSCIQNSILKIIENPQVRSEDYLLTDNQPPTLSEPGTNGRYIFSKEVFGLARSLLRQSEMLPPVEARLFRILIGSVLIENSNVVINGKGRRYKKNWQRTEKNSKDFILSIRNAAEQMQQDLEEFKDLPRLNNKVLRGDSRVELSRVRKADVAIFSPPYPNSFDYTDVYNVELWMLGYLKNAPDNRALRQKTLRSHVQTSWDNKNICSLSPELKKVFSLLSERSAELWDNNIPSMVCYYFADLKTIFQHLARILKVGHHAVVAIGDSKYVGVHIDVSKILSEIVIDLGFRVSEVGSIRSMRSSSQHGGNLDLQEHCIVFEKFRE